MKLNFRFFLQLAVAVVLSSCAKEPQASFTVSKTAVNEGEEIVFTNTSVNAASVEWDFGDGSTSSENSVKKIFSSGRHNVTLTAYSKNKKKSDSHSETITVNKLYLSAVIDGAVLAMPASSTGIYYTSSKSLESCGNGNSTGLYRTELESGDKNIIIGKGTLSWECANPAPKQSFKDFFAPGTSLYSRNALNGIEITHNDGLKTWSTSNGSADQSGSSFVISSITEETLLGNYYIRVSGSFNCRLYDDAGNVKTISSATFKDVPFHNM
jgi:PKD repeat protein